MQPSLRSRLQQVIHFDGVLSLVSTFYWCYESAPPTVLKLSRQPDCSSKFKYMPLPVLLSGSPEFLKLTLRVGLSADREASRLANDRSQ